jgi:enoyl-[acyl-carrier protein] reductase III
MNSSVRIDLSNRFALVTGGSRGIGRAIAVELGRCGARVAVNYLRNRTAAEETAAAIRAAAGPEPLIVKANVAEDEHQEQLFLELKDAFGALDILVSNAASGVLKPAAEITAKHFDWTMAINARALLGLAQRALPLMDGRNGRIIAVSSLGAARAIPFYTAVGASKGALESLVRHLALELGPRGIRINIVSPGVVDTDALHHFPNRRDAGIEPPRHTGGTAGDARRCGPRRAWLASDAAAMIHGQTIVVDGGYSIVAWPER